MANYCIAVDLNGVTTWDAAVPNVTIPFTPKTISVVNEHGSMICLVSLDGSTLAGRINPAVIAGQRFTQHTTKVWLKAAADPGAPAIVTVSAAD